VEQGRAQRADYKLLGKVLTRKGNALVKLNRCAGQTCIG
jgi:hypothetical protein